MPIVKEKELKKLLDVAGNEFTLDYKDVQFGRVESGTIMLPQQMTYGEAVFWLNLKLTEEETVVEIHERIEGYPIDVAYAMQLAIQEIFGVKELKSTPGMFKDTAPTFMTVSSDCHGGKVEVYIGRFGVPGCEGYLETDRDFNDALWVTGKMKQKSLPIVRALLKRTEQLLFAKSLYKGKAFRVEMIEQTQGFTTKETMANPEFIDVSHVPAQLILNEDTAALLNAALWTPVARTSQTRHYKVSLKRGILLEGPYGTGKSLTALEMARLCQENGWTFIYLKDVKDLKRVYPFALRYAPSVLFAEDIDLVIKHADDNGEDGVNMLNNVLDGVDNKNAPVIVVLTTNHVDRLPQSLLRPGRFDAIVPYRLPNRITAAKLVQQYAGSDLDTEKYDADKVGEALKGNQPAILHEIVKRAKLFAQGRYPDSHRTSLLLSTEDILLSNTSMQHHLDLLNRKPDHQDTAMEQLGNAVAKHVVKGVYEVMLGQPQLAEEPHRTREAAVSRRTNGAEERVS